MDCSGVTIPVLKQDRCEGPGVLLGWNMFFDLHNQCNYKSRLFHHNGKTCYLSREKGRGGAQEKAALCSSKRKISEGWIPVLSASLPWSSVCIFSEEQARASGILRALSLSGRQYDSFNLGNPWWKCICSCRSILHVAIRGRSAGAWEPVHSEQRHCCVGCSLLGHQAGPWAGVLVLCKKHPG